jgi:hypothetical protein
MSLEIAPPNSNRIPDGTSTDVLNQYVVEAKALLGKMNQGATIYPECDGIWWKRGDAEPTYEKTRVVYSFVDPHWFKAGLPDIRKFLHRFGRETRQDQVFVEFDGWALQIENYDVA